MLLAIDVGNSRVKWASWRDANWHDRGAVATDTAELDELVKAADSADAVVACCVAEPSARTRIDDLLGAGTVAWIDAQAQLGEVHNHYQPPQSLGADRWCALLGLREHYQSGTVVLAGTAVTVDQLNADGSFAGGLILPGRNLMHQALANFTQLQPPEPTSTDVADVIPNSTSAAIRTGCLRAVAGAISSQRQLWQAQDEPLVLAGGDAEALIGLLPDSVLIPDLILDGLRLNQPRI